MLETRRRKQLPQHNIPNNSIGSNHGRNNNEETSAKNRVSSSGAARKNILLVLIVLCITYAIKESYYLIFTLEYAQQDTMPIGKEVQQPMIAANVAANTDEFGIDTNMYIASKVRPSSTVPPKKPRSDHITMPTEFARPKGIDPFKSSPPPKIELFETDNPRIRKRHQCIAKIRERLHQKLGPHVQKFAHVQRPALIVDPSFHANVGDSMLTYGEIEFLRSFGFVEHGSVQFCGSAQSMNWIKDCGLFLKEKDPKQVLAGSIAYYNANGNWGDLYHFIQKKRMKNFKSLLEANYSVVSMPQSFHYGNNNKKARDTQRLKESITAGLNLSMATAAFLNESEAAKQQVASRMTFAWREAESFEAASKEHPFVTNVLVLDIAFSLGPFQQQPTPEKESFQLDLLMFLRTDRESVVKSKRNTKSIQGILNGMSAGSGLKFGIVDWNTRFAMWPSDDHLFTDSAIQLLSLGRVVVLDRLHAAILCYLSGIPFIYINQSTGKINKTLSVAFDSWEGCSDGETAMWAEAHSLEEAIPLAVGFLQKYGL